MESSESYYREHKEERLKYQKEYNKLYYDKIKLYHNSYWLKHKEELLEKRREYEKKNEEKMRELRKKWYLKRKNKKKPNLPTKVVDKIVVGFGI